MLKNLGSSAKNQDRSSDQKHNYFLIGLINTPISKLVTDAEISVSVQAFIYPSTDSVILYSTAILFLNTPEELLFFTFLLVVPENINKKLLYHNKFIFCIVFYTILNLKVSSNIGIHCFNVIINHHGILFLCMRVCFANVKNLLLCDYDQPPRNHNPEKRLTMDGTDVYCCPEHVPNLPCNLVLLVAWLSSMLARFRSRFQTL